MKYDEFRYPCGCILVVRSQEVKWCDMHRKMIAEYEADKDKDKEKEEVR
jgi:hypothetical protein